jgi:uncharacterized SAM-binding protein YcdF (DUF218 family)
MSILIKVVIGLIVAGLIYFLAVFTLIMTFDSTISEEELANADYIVILGSSIIGTTPGNRMQERLDYAMPYILASDIPVIVSGGQGPDEETFEAYVMRDYLISQGVDATRIITETKATSTFENLIYSKELMEIDDPNILVISSDYHMFRVNMLCNRLGYNCNEGGADTSNAVYQITREIITVGKSFVFDR